MPASQPTQPRHRPPPPPPPWHKKLRTVGVTGTNGKTSTTATIAALLEPVYGPVPRATTVGFYLGVEKLDLNPGYPAFLETMRRGVLAGAKWAAIELTSESMALGFMRAWPCQIGVFTNLTRDHLDSHKTPEHYLASKAQLFMQLPEGGTAVLNGCDEASDMLDEVIPPGVQRIRYGVSSRGRATHSLDLYANRVELSWEGSKIHVVSSDAFGAAPKALFIRAIGDVFVENALAAYCAAVAAGVDRASAAESLAKADPPPGRFEVVGSNPTVVVDFAHTPDALERTLATALTLARGKVTVVCGAGGNRDKPKRPLIGAAASKAHRVVLTSDNPRDEDPAEIVRQIRGGISSPVAVDEVLDREAAIRMAISEAADNDVVLVAGKGHEVDQIIAGVHRHFSDKEVALDALRERKS